MRKVVDSTARSFGLATMYDPPGPGYHKYFRGMGEIPLGVVTVLDEKISLSYYLGDKNEMAGIYLEVQSKKKTKEFIKIEENLTPALLRIDPDLVIKSGYFPNPMM